MAIRRIALPIFNRATYGRCKTLIQRLNDSDDYELTLALSSSLLEKKFGNAQEYIKQEHDNTVTLEVGDSTGVVNASSQILQKVGQFVHNGNFDAVVVVADRYETLPAAYAAALCATPIIHIQGGEVTGNIDERVRHGVTKLSDFHCVSTEMAKNYVVEMGEQFNRVKNTGCPSIDLLKINNIKRWRSKEPYYICIFHPDTEATDLLEQTEVVILAAIDYCNKYGSKCYWFYPNSDRGREDIVKMLDERIKQCEFIVPYVNEEPEEFLYRLAGAELIMGNSSCALRESSVLGLPAINIGDRQRARERSWNVMDSVVEYDEIRHAMDYQREMYRYRTSRLYGDGNAGQKIVHCLNMWDFSLKREITYPYHWRFKEKHFSSRRLDRHVKPTRPRHKILT